MRGQTVLWRLFLKTGTALETCFESTGSQFRDNYIARLKFYRRLGARKLPKGSRLSFQGCLKENPCA